MPLEKDCLNLNKKTFTYPTQFTRKVVKLLRVHQGDLIHQTVSPKNSLNGPKHTHNHRILNVLFLKDLPKMAKSPGFLGWTFENLKGDQPDGHENQLKYGTSPNWGSEMSQ